MKISVSLPESDIAFLDQMGTNRSAVLHEAVQLLRRRDLGEQYAQEFAQFADSGDQQLWDTTLADGLDA